MTSIPISICKLSLYRGFGKEPTNRSYVTGEKFAPLHRNRLVSAAYMERGRCFLGRGELGVWIKDEGCKRNKRLVKVRFNDGFGFNGGGGGGGRDNGNNARILGNLALAAGLTYLSMTGQLGWILDAIVSIWLVVVLVPILGLGAFLWWAGRDIVQSSCPNCGNEFQIFKSSLNDEVQLCPFCSQPFSVVDNKFVKEAVKFSNQGMNFGQDSNGFSSKPYKDKDYSTTIVDVEAQVKDAD